MAQYTDFDSIFVFYMLNSLMLGPYFYHWIFMSTVRTERPKALQIREQVPAWHLFGNTPLMFLSKAPSLLLAFVLYQVL